MGTDWARTAQDTIGDRGRDSQRKPTEHAHAVVLKSRAARKGAPPEFTLQATFEFDEIPAHPFSHGPIAGQFQTPPSATRSLSPERKRSMLLLLARAARTRSMSPQKVEMRLFASSTFGRVPEEQAMLNPRARLLSRARAARGNAPEAGPVSGADTAIKPLDEGNVDSCVDTTDDAERSALTAADKCSVAKPVEQIAMHCDDDTVDGHSGPDATRSSCRTFLRRADVGQTRCDGNGQQCALQFKSEREAAGQMRRPLPLINHSKSSRHVPAVFRREGQISIRSDSAEGIRPAQFQAQSLIARAGSILEARSIKEEQHMLIFDVVEKTQVLWRGKAAPVCHDLILQTDFGGVKGRCALCSHSVDSIFNNPVLLSDIQKLCESQVNYGFLSITAKRNQSKFVVRLLFGDPAQKESFLSVVYRLAPTVPLEQGVMG